MDIGKMEGREGRRRRRTGSTTWIKLKPHTDRGEEVRWAELGTGCLRQTTSQNIEVQLKPQKPPRPNPNTMLPPPLPLPPKQKSSFKQQTFFQKSLRQAYKQRLPMKSRKPSTELKVDKLHTSMSVCSRRKMSSEDGKNASGSNTSGANNIRFLKKLTLRRDNKEEVLSGCSTLEIQCILFQANGLRS